MLVPVPFREHKYGLLQCRSFEVFEDFFEILLVLFSFKIKFLTLNLLVKRKHKKQIVTFTPSHKCTFILSKS